MSVDIPTLRFTLFYMEDNKKELYLQLIQTDKLVFK